MFDGLEMGIFPQIARSALGKLLSGAADENTIKWWHQFIDACFLFGAAAGGLIFGWLGDRIGRRASILLAGVLFVTTAICGAMPGFSWNLLMCFLMGLGGGGMLPIAFALLAETIPARHRGWLMVLIGGDVAGAYVITSWLSESLTPHYSWRIMWLLGLPTGLLLLLLNRWIPESPRFLLAMGRDEEARLIMDRYSARVVPDESGRHATEAPVHGGYTQLLARPFLGITATVMLLGLGVGLVTYGFQLWIPSNLRGLGFTQVTADRILRESALIGFPLNFVVAWMYGFWSSRRTLIVLAALNAAALLGFVAAGDRVANNGALLHGLLVIPIWGISSVTATLVCYSAEAYPTRIRSRGAGLAAGAAKVGGVLVIAFVAAAVTAPSIAGTALIGAIPMALAAIAAAMYGIETQRRPLEEITAQELGMLPNPAQPT